MGTPATKTREEVDLILNGPVIPASKLDANNWMIIVMNVLGICNLQLKHFTHLANIGDKIRGSFGDMELPEGVLELPAGINEKMSCLRIAELYSIDEFSDPHSFGQGGTADIHLSADLLLLRTGNLLLWEVEYKRVNKQHPYYALGRKKVDIYEVCRFLPVPDGDLFPLLEKYPHIGPEIVKEVSKAAQRTFETRKKWLEDSEFIAHRIVNIRSRIDFTN